MATGMRKSGIDVVGEMPWGSHFCFFYETKGDLLDMLVPYCKAGLESGEFCLWVVAKPLTIEEAADALKDAVPDLDRYLADSSVEIVPARDWYLQDGTFDLKKVTASWHEKLARASARGYAGVRVTGDTAWLEKKDWQDFCEYEEGLNEACANRDMAVLCTYPLGACGAVEILDVVRTHQFALAKRHGDWDVIETAGVKLAKAEIKRLNEELEQRVVERTSQLHALEAANAQLAAACVDINERERHQQQVNLLLREVNHRCKNMLTVVQSIARQTVAATTDQFIECFAERIQALSASQDLLIENEWRGVNLNELARSQFGHFKDLVGKRIELRGPPLVLSAPASHAIGMALHELATNAGKYGALSDGNGCVEVGWSFVPNEGGSETFVISWRERGGPTVRAPSRAGFGSTVLRRVAEESLDAKVELNYASTGLVWRLQCPAGEVTSGGRDRLGNITKAGTGTLGLCSAPARLP